MVGILGKKKYSRKPTKKTAWKKRGSTSARKPYGAKKRVFKFSKSAGKKWRKGTRRGVSGKQVASGLGDQAILFDYVDKPAFVNTTNAIAKQFVWASNCVASPAVTVGQAINLMLDSGTHLEAMFVQAASQSILGLQAPASGVVNSGSNIRIIRKTAEVQCRITNCETAPVELWEYRVCARRDQTILPGALWYQAGQAEVSAIGIAYNALGTTVAPSALAAGGYATPVGVTPYMLHAFVSQYKILKVKKRELAPGRSMKIKYSFKKPRQYAWSNLCSTLGGPGVYGQAAPGGIPYVVRKGQCLSLFVAKGTIVTGSSANASYQVGISNVNIGMEYMYRYHYNYVMATNATATSQQSIPGFSLGVAQAPLPVVANVPQLVITPATGALTYALNSATGATSTIDINELTV